MQDKLDTNKSLGNCLLVTLREIAGVLLLFETLFQIFFKRSQILGIKPDNLDSHNSLGIISKALAGSMFLALFSTLCYKQQGAVSSY